MQSFSSLALCAVVGACTPLNTQPSDFESGTKPGSGDESGQSPGTGATPDGVNFDLLLTDAPGDFDEVWVTIRSIEISSVEGGWLALSDTPQSFDLLSLQNDVTAALAGAALQPGTYPQLRLLVDDAFVVTGGTSEALHLASGIETGIKINLDATVELGMAYTVVLDFDAHQSVKHTGQGWLLTPVIKLESFDAIALPDDDGSEAQDAGETEAEGDAGAGLEPEA